MVNEAARAMVNLKNVTVHEVQPARCGLILWNASRTGALHAVNSIIRVYFRGGRRGHLPPLEIGLPPLGIDLS